MTKSEIEQNAEEYADEYATPDLDCIMRTHLYECAKQSHINGALSRQPEIDEAREIIREYIRLSLQEDKDMIANIELFKKAKQFLGE